MNYRLWIVQILPVCVEVQSQKLLPVLMYRFTEAACSGNFEHYIS